MVTIVTLAKTCRAPWPHWPPLDSTQLHGERLLSAPFTGGAHSGTDTWGDVPTGATWFAERPGEAGLPRYLQGGSIAPLAESLPAVSLLTLSWSEEQIARWGCWFLTSGGLALSMTGWGPLPICKPG